MIMTDVIRFCISNQLYRRARFSTTITIRRWLQNGDVGEVYDHQDPSGKPRILMIFLSVVNFIAAFPWIFVFNSS
jgi:hypothetical protein